MSLPAGLPVVPFTAGPYTDGLGRPYVGKLTITPSVPRVVWLPTGAVVLDGAIDVALDAAGAAAFSLPTVDAVGLSTTGFTYTVQFSMRSVSGQASAIYPFIFTAPQGSGTLDLDTLTGSESSTGVPVQVPVGMTRTAADALYQPLLHDRGSWAATTAYVVADVVTQAGSRYVCKTAHTSAGSFSSTNWIGLGGGSSVTIDSDGTLIVDGVTVELATDASLARYPDGITIAGPVPRPTVIDARDFGVVANGPTTSGALTSNTNAFQTFVNYVQTNHCAGILPSGQINIFGQILFRMAPQWSLDGAGRRLTTIKQFADNVPIFNLGYDNAGPADSVMHSIGITNMSFDYNSNQPATNTAATPIQFSTMVWAAQYRNLSFDHGYYAMAVVPNVGSPWGSSWDDLEFSGGLTGGAISMAGGLYGPPNNHFGRMYATCANMVGPVFYLSGQNMRIDAIEFINAYAGAGLMYFTAGTLSDIGTVKLEQGTFTATSKLFYFEPNTKTNITQILIGAYQLRFDVPGGQDLILVDMEGSNPGEGWLNIEAISVGPHGGAGSGAGASRIFKAGAPVSVGHISYMASDVWTLGNNGSTPTAEWVTVRDAIGGKISQNLGDTDFTVDPIYAPPNVLSFSTPFTAPRSVVLPNNSDKCFNGLWYEIVLNGAVNGINTLIVKVGSSTLMTIAEDGVAARFMWRRGTGWFITKYAPIRPGVTASADDPLIYAAALG